MRSAFYQEFLAKILKYVKQTKSINQIQSELISNLNYKLRTPLTSIVGMAQLLSMDTLLPNQQKYISDILSAAEHMLSLVDELLENTSPESDQLVVNQESFNFKILLQTVMDMLSFHAYAKGLQFSLNYADDAPVTVMGDMRLLRHISLNLLSRALKSTEQGSVIVQVSCLNHFDQTAELSLTIKDTGTPMSEEELVKVKACLTPDAPQTVRRYGSIDLGLLITIGHLRLIQAGMEVSSTAQGTTICCTIPFQLATAASVTQAIRSEPTAVYSPNRKIRILLVEDDEIIQTVHCAILHKMQAIVDVAHNSEITLDYYQSKAYDLILMDIGLPDCDGLETTRKIRALEALIQKRTPIIALTAHCQKEDTEIFLSAGIDEVLIKPINHIDFGHLIEKWVIRNTPK